MCMSMIGRRSAARAGMAMSNMMAASTRLIARPPPEALRVKSDLDYHSCAKAQNSIAPQQARQLALDVDLLGPVALRVVEAVGGIEADHLAFAAEGLER